MTNSHSNALVIEGHAREVAPAFDYGVLSPALAERARRVAQQIRSNHELQVLAVLEIGRDLAGIKDELGHGHFGAWLKAEFNMTDRTARRYMQAAQELGDKSDTVSVLTVGELHQLAAALIVARMPDDAVKLAELFEVAWQTDLFRAVTKALGQ